MAQTITRSQLFTDGYRARSSSRLHVVEIVKPDGTVYLVRPVTGTCSCEARVVCKHLKQVAELVFDSTCEVEGYLNDWQAYDLRVQWAQIVEAGVKTLTQDTQTVVSPAPVAASTQAAQPLRITAAQYSANPSRFGLYGRQTGNGAWITLGTTFRSEAEAWGIRNTTYRASERYSEYSVRRLANGRRLDVAA